MRILKLLNKKVLSIIIFFLLSSFSLVAEEQPIDTFIGYPKYLRIGTFIIAPVIPIGADINPDIRPSIIFGYNFILDLIRPTETCANIKYAPKK